MNTKTSNPIVRMLAVLMAAAMALMGLVSLSPSALAVQSGEPPSDTNQQSEGDAPASTSETTPSTNQTSDGVEGSGLTTEISPDGLGNIVSGTVESESEFPKISPFGIGTGGVGGGGGGGAGTNNILFYFGDDLNRLPNPYQGWNQSSIDYAFNQVTSWFDSNGYLASGSNFYMTTTKKHFDNACGDALAEARTSAPAGPNARVVGVGMAWNVSSGGNVATWGATLGTWQSMFDSLWPTQSNSLVGYGATYKEAVRVKFRAALFNDAHVVCVALNENQWPTTYTQNISTDKGPVPAVGSATPVYDSVNMSRNGGSNQRGLTARVILQYSPTGYGQGGPTANEGTKSKNKACTVNNYQAGQCKSTTFVPADFGWETWPKGYYWFNVTMQKQGNMAAAASHMGAQVERERFHLEGYDLTLATDANNAFEVAGGTQTVTDTVTATVPSGTLAETLDATFTLNFSGTPGAEPSTAKSEKAGKITSSGKSDSPGFTPEDLGMTTWAPGKYWFDVNVPLQSNMAAAASHNGKDDPRESWDASTPITVETTAQATFSTSGGKESVFDRVESSAPGYSGQTTIPATVTLNWDGYPQTDKVVAKASKTFQMKVGKDNVTETPKFAPSDFGWEEWPAGRFWYDISAEKQSWMSGPVVTPARVPSETWEPGVPAPEKTLTAPGDGSDLGENPHVAAGQTVDARIKASAGGVTKFWIKDTLHDGRVHLGTTGDAAQGATPTDTPSGIYVLDPEGNRLPASQVKITISPAAPAARTVTAEVSSASGNLPLGFYTLVVPTTPVASAYDYTFADTGSACWAGENTDCKDTETVEPGKVTPDPDKVWALDENGALAVTDPNWTNNEGADGMTFLPGDQIYATVNDNIFKKGTPNKPLDLPLQSYNITDIWTDALDYIDFNHKSLAKVWWKPLGASGYSDVTSQFDIVIDAKAGTTSATAKKGSAFLADTGLPGKGGSVKLTIGGTFKDDIDTNGLEVTILNDGSVTWNSEKKPTNKPPVFIWTPDPDKDVLGAPENGGGDESINGQSVFPGQILKYQVKLDTTLPEGMAWDVTKFGMIDYYDPKFSPNKSSIEVTGRDGVIAKSNYKVTWNDSDPMNPYFELLFKESWIKDYLLDYQYDSDGKPVTGPEGRRYLTVTFTGKVKEGVRPGDVVENQAFQLINNSKTPTPIPEVTIPPTEPDKEDLRCTVNPETQQYENCDDIDGKVVVKGDYIDYRLTMDARPAASKFAYLVHKLGMIDDYDEEYLSLQESDVKVTVATVGSDAKDKFRAGQDVTDMFNIQVDQETGIAYVFAKTVDTPSSVDEGETISGDPQPADLAAYAAAAIDPLKDPAIDQDLLGNTYYIYLRTQVTKETDDYVIENQAQQNFNNMTTVTKVVSNPLKEINPGKDVTVEVDGESINHGEVPLNGSFNYLLRSSVIPANRAYESSEWYIVDDYNEEYDRYTGQWLIQTQTDIYDGETLVAKAGDTIASSKFLEEKQEGFVGKPGLPVKPETVAETSQSGDGEEGTPEPEKAPFFQDSFTVVEKDGVLTVTALKDSYFDTINTRLDLEQGWQAYVQFERIRPGEVTNVLTEYYNGTPREPEEVVTKTPENPAISLVKYDVASGIEDGDRNEASEALTIKSDKPIRIAFLGTNTGDVPLQNITLTDVTTLGTGKVTDITCKPKLEGLILEVGDTFLCEGNLTEVTAGTSHTNNATVTGESIYTGKKVTDEDPWNGVREGKLAKTGATVGTALALGVAAFGLGGVLLAVRRRPQGSHAA